MDFPSDWGWTIFGPLVLLGVIAFGFLTRRRLRASTQRQQDAAVDAGYEEEPGRRTNPADVETRRADVASGQRGDPDASTDLKIQTPR